MAAPAYDPAPLRDAFEGYRGTMRDAADGRALGPDALRRGRDRVAAALAGYRGRTVALHLDNGLAVPVAFFGAIEAGANVLVLPGSRTADEVDGFVRATAAAAVVTESARLDGLAGAGSARPLEPEALPDLRVVPLGTAAPAAGLAGLEGVPLHPTSGTTAEAKIAVRPGAAAVEEARHYIETLALDNTDGIVCPVPLVHAYGFGMGLMVALRTSADLTVIRGLQPRVVARLAREPETRVLLLVPALLPAVARSAGPLPGLRYVLTAGSPLTAAAATDFADVTGRRPCPLYGTTETGGISINATGDPDAGVGPAMAGVSVAAVPAEDTGAATLHVASSSMMAGYLGPSGIDRGRVADGWFDTGDLARLDDGVIRLSGRTGDLINVLGRKVLCSEVEETIGALAEVAEVKVYPGLDDRGREVVSAAVVARGLDETAIRRHCLTRLSPEKCPSRIAFLDALPTTPGGKIITRALPGAKPAGA